MNPATNSAIFEKFAKHLDQLGLVGKAGDFGDCCSNQFALLYCAPHSPDEQLTALSWLVLNGVPRRHPDPLKWYCGINRTSRDQLIPYLCYVASPARTALPEVTKAYYKALVVQHAKHLFLLTWNTRRNFQYPTLAEHQALSTPDVKWNYAWKLPDICGPDIWACYLRGAMQYWPALRCLWPLLNLLDLYQLADVAFIYLQLAQGKKIGPTSQARSIDHDKKNTALLAHHAAHHMPTLLSKLTWKLLKPIAQQAALSFYTQAEEPPLHLAIELLS